MAEMTHHDHSLAELVNERHEMVNRAPNGQMLNMADEGHVFDHEPGMTDYHHD